MLPNKTFFFLLSVFPLTQSWIITVKLSVDMDENPIEDIVEYEAAPNAFDLSGKGNYGTVLKATDKKTGNLVAIKYAQLANSNGPKTAHDFHYNEFGAYVKLAKLGIYKDGFPRVILQGFANITENGQAIFPVIVMDYYEQNLAQHLGLEQSKHRWEYLTLEQFIRFCLQILRILRVLKQWGIIHRDFKPTNFMVDSEGNLRVVDFGLSSYKESKLETSKPNGSPLYRLRSDFDNYNGPNHRHDFVAFVCMMPELVLGYNGVDEEMDLFNPSVPPTDEAKYSSSLGKDWKIPYYRSRYDEVLKKAFEGQEPKVLVQLREIVLKMYIATESKENIDYQNYYDEFGELLKYF